MTTPAPIVIRPAAVSDLSAITELVRAGELPTHGVDAALLDGLCVATRDGVVVGGAAVERCGADGLLRSVVVAVHARRHGLGARLVSDRLGWAARADLQSLYLLTTTAVRFFGRLGFEIVPRQSLPASIRATNEFTTLCPDTAVAMRCATSVLAPNPLTEDMEERGDA